MCCESFGKLWWSRVGEWKGNLRSGLPGRPKFRGREEQRGPAKKKKKRMIDDIGTESRDQK